MMKPDTHDRPIYYGYKNSDFTTRRYSLALSPLAERILTHPTTVSIILMEKWLWNCLASDGCRSFQTLPNWSALYRSWRTSHRSGRLASNKDVLLLLRFIISIFRLIFSVHCVYGCAVFDGSFKCQGPRRRFDGGVAAFCGRRRAPSILSNQKCRLTEKESIRHRVTGRWRRHVLRQLSPKGREEKRKQQKNTFKTESFQSTSSSHVKRSLSCEIKESTVQWEREAKEKIAVFLDSWKNSFQPTTKDEINKKKLEKDLGRLACGRVAVGLFNPRWCIVCVTLCALHTLYGDEETDDDRITLSIFSLEKIRHGLHCLPTNEPFWWWAT